jgi:anthranilate/para-aminobenzoate synthase component II
MLPNVVGQTLARRLRNLAAAGYTNLAVQGSKDPNSIVNRPEPQRQRHQHRQADRRRRSRAGRRQRHQRFGLLKLTLRGRRMPPMRVLVIDNYDSFVYNLVQYLAQLGAEHRRRATTRSTLDELADGRRRARQPGPGTPERAGRARSAIRGRCAAAAAVRGLPGPPGHRRGLRRRRRARAASCCTARPSQVHHNGAGVLAGLPSPFTATRYHSLAIGPTPCRAELEVTGRPRAA